MLLFQEFNNLKNWKSAYRTADYEGGHVIKDSKGNVIMTRKYHFTNNSGDKIIIQDHSAGRTKGGQGPHFNVRPADKPPTGKVEGQKNIIL